MAPYQQVRLICIRMFFLVVLAALSTISSAETIKIEGLIKARSGSTMMVETSELPNLLVLLTDSTKVGQIQGALKARKKQMSMAALIPGLAVRVEGTYNAHHELVAKSVSFKGNDLQHAQSIQAGMHETKLQTQQNQEQIEKQKANLAAQKEALKQQQEELAAQQQKVAANKAAIEAAVARFGELDDYYILDEITVYFGNGKTTITPEYRPQLLQLADKAKTVNAYMIQIVGYASSSGSAALNQKLSDDRATNVANFLMQQAHVPLTNMLAPGAMGESQNSTNEKASEAENRRVVVRVIQNKGIAGL